MAIRVYNTLSGTKEPFEPITPGKVGIYLCGPTVYKPSHIGHAVGPVIFDAIKRYLTFRGYDVTWVVNITDVEDKLIAEAAAQNTTVQELAERITASYKESLRQLGVESIDHYPKASEYIGKIIAFIEKLVAKDAAYEVNGDVYFDVTKDDDYGKLTNRSTEDQEGQRDLQSGEKRNPADFALWKAAKPEEPEEVKYDSPWGKGRPGWHIECSVMSCDILGETFDIHGGGLDLKFPHHENEIAQSETCNDKPFAKYWLHNGLTRFNTKKISKSDAEMAKFMDQMTLTNLLAKYGGELLRYLLLSTQYRRPIDFSDEEMEAKRKGLTTFHRLFERVERICGDSPYGDSPTCTDMPVPECESCKNFRDEVLPYREKFIEAMDDDFNTAGAIATLFDFASRINRFIDEKKLESEDVPTHKATALAATRELVELARLLGLFLAPPADVGSAGSEKLGEVMQVLIDLRQHCRKSKNFELADMIRDRLGECGITLVDRPDGTGWEME